MTSSLTWDISGTQVPIEGVPATMDFHDPANGYTLTRLDDGGMKWRRNTVDSIFVPGRTSTGAVKDVAERVMGIKVKANSVTQFHTRMNALLDFLSFPQYNILVMLNGSLFSTWLQCEPAEWQIEGGWNKYLLMASPIQSEVVFTIPSLPS